MTTLLDTLHVPTVDRWVSFDGIEWFPLVDREYVVWPGIVQTKQAPVANPMRTFDKMREIEQRQKFKRKRGGRSGVPYTIQAVHAK